MHDEPGTASGLHLRPGRPDDSESLAALMFEEPGREAVAMAGSAAGAEHLEARILRDSIGRGASVVIVAELDGAPVGFADIWPSGGLPLSALARHAVAAVGLSRALMSGWKLLTVRRRVDMPSPPGGVVLGELHVSPRHRGRGVGGVLLAEVARYATGQGSPRISLTTAVDNPARRLYERNGYRVVAEKIDARYERLSGSRGRVQMVKDL